MSSTGSDAPGLDRARRVVEALASGSCHAHAVLFYGQEGAGAEGLARELARRWLARSDSADDPVARAFEAGRAVDFQEVGPAGPSAQIKLSAIQSRGSKADGGEDHGVVPLIEFFRSPPLVARHKVFLIRSAERLNRDAANALLKTLEEPHAHGKAILTTSELGRVVPTVRSRCLTVACEVPSGWCPDDRLERLFGPTPGLAERVRAHRAAYEGLLRVLDRLRESPSGGALGLASQYREAADALAHATDSTARAAQAEAMRCAAAWLRSEAPDQPRLVLLAAESHRLILQNLNAGPVFDLFFAEATASRTGLETGRGNRRELADRPKA